MFKLKERRKELRSIQIIKIEWNKGVSSIIPFETHIPKDIKRSYFGEYSEYYWLLEAKGDILWSDDLYDRAIIQII